MSDAGLYDLRGSKIGTPPVPVSHKAHGRIGHFAEVHMDPVVDLKKRTVTIGTDVYQFVSTEYPDQFYVHCRRERVGSARYVFGGVFVQSGAGFSADLLTVIGAAYFTAVRHPDTAK